MQFEQRREILQKYEIATRDVKSQAGQPFNFLMGKYSPEAVMNRFILGGEFHSWMTGKENAYLEALENIKQISNSAPSGVSITNHLNSMQEIWNQFDELSSTAMDLILSGKHKEYKNWINSEPIGGWISAQVESAQQLASIISSILETFANTDSQYYDEIIKIRKKIDDYYSNSKTFASNSLVDEFKSLEKEFDSAIESHIKLELAFLSTISQIFDDPIDECSEDELENLMAFTLNFEQDLLNKYESFYKKLLNQESVQDADNIAKALSGMKPNSVTDQLTDLKASLDAGLISLEEFTKAKNKILGF